MRFEIDGRSVFASDGGAYEAGRPLAIFLHGAGMDRSVWALQCRWFSHHGWNGVAVDLPGHGASQGPCLPDIGALADWTAAVIAALGAECAALAGHSMGALVALETAARTPARVSALALIGVAAKMPVHPDLLTDARANARDAIDRVSLWSLGPTATMGAAASPGVWMLGATEHMLARAAPGVLFTDLAACNGYSGALAAAAKVACPTRLILGERDQMTPPKGGRVLASAIRNSSTVVIPGAGHMLTTEKPTEALAALRAAFAPAPAPVI